MKLLFLDIDGVLNCPTTAVHYPEGSLFCGVPPMSDPDPGTERPVPPLDEPSLPAH